MNLHIHSYNARARAKKSIMMLFFAGNPGSPAEAVPRLGIGVVRASACVNMNRQWWVLTFGLLNMNMNMNMIGFIQNTEVHEVGHAWRRTDVRPGISQPTQKPV